MAPHNDERPDWENNNNNTDPQMTKTTPQQQLLSPLLPDCMRTMTKEEAINAIIYRTGDYVTGTDIYLGPPTRFLRPPISVESFEENKTTKIDYFTEDIYIGPSIPSVKQTLEDSMLELLVVKTVSYEDYLKNKKNKKKNKTKKKKKIVLTEYFKNTLRRLVKEKKMSRSFAKKYLKAKTITV